MRIHRTQNSCFAQFIQQIRSASTEQFQVGVKSSLNGLRIKKSQLRKGSQQKRTNSYWKTQSRKKWILWCKLQGAIIGHLETDCENVFRTSKHWRKISKLQKFGKESLLGWALLDVDDGFGDRTQHVEHSHFLVEIKIPESMRRFQDKL